MRLRVEVAAVDAAPMIDACRARQDVPMDAELMALLQQEGLTARGYEATESPLRLGEERETRPHHPLDTRMEGEWIA